MTCGIALWSAAASQPPTTRLFTVPEPATVSVEVTSGSVTVSGWDKPDISVEAATSGSAARQGAVTPVMEQNGTSLRVSAVQTGDRRDTSVTTAITIKAPWRTNFDPIRVTRGRITLTGLRGIVSAKTEEGDLVASEMAGAMRLETTLGDLIVSARTTAAGLIRLRAFHGDVKLRLDPLPSDVRILATTFNGKISSDIPLRMKDGFGVRFAETTLGQGEPVISIDVVTGDVVITSGSRF